MINPSTNSISYIFVLTLILLIFYTIYCCFTANEANKDTPSPIPFRTIIDKLDTINDFIK